MIIFSVLELAGRSPSLPCCMKMWCVKEGLPSLAGVGRSWGISGCPAHSCAVISMLLWCGGMTAGGYKGWNKVFHCTSQKRGSCNYAHLALFHLPLGDGKGSHVKVYLLLALFGLSQIREGGKVTDDRTESLFFFFLLTWMLALLCDDHIFSQFGLGHAKAFTAFRPFNLFKILEGEEGNKK